MKMDNDPKDNKPLALSPGAGITGEVVEIFAATTNEDRTEGRGRDIDVSYHLTYTEALIATKGIGVLAEDGKVASRIALRWTDESTKEVCYFLLPAQRVEITEDPEAEARVREEALAKLTKAEQAAIFRSR